MSNSELFPEECFEYKQRTTALDTDIARKEVGVVQVKTLITDNSEFRGRNYTWPKYQSQLSKDTKILKLPSEEEEIKTRIIYFQSMRDALNTDIFRDTCYFNECLVSSTNI